MSVPSSKVGGCVKNSHNHLPIKMEQSVPKRRHINFRRLGIAQKKVYNLVESS